MDVSPTKSRPRTIASAAGCPAALSVAPRRTPPRRTHLILAAALALSILAAGCSSAAIKRRQTQDPAAYQALPPDQKALVNRGRIEVGMTTNAVWIAWGTPTRVVAFGPDPTSFRWEYDSDWRQPVPYWSEEPSYGGAPTYTFRTSTMITRFLSGWVEFQAGRVTAWSQRSSPENPPTPPMQRWISPTIPPVFVPGTP